MKMKMVEAAKITLFALALCLPVAAFAGPATDGDGDGVPDVIDNCSTVANAGASGCDDDIDGYGNFCDGDFNNDNVSDGIDFAAPYFLTDFGTGTQANNPAGNPQGTDMNCDNVVDGVDFATPFFLTQFGTGAPGPSGLSCAGSVPCL